MRMRIAAVMLAASLVAFGGLLLAGITPEWLERWSGATPGALEALGLAVAGFGLFQLGRRRPKVRFVMD